MSFFEFKKNNNNKLNQLNIQQIISFIYNENFNDILIIEKTKFLKNIEIKLIDILKRQNKLSKLDYENQFSIYQKEKENINNLYEKDYSLLKKELIKYSKSPNEIKYLTNFRKHCIDLSQISLHKCSENKLGKFIEVYEEKKRKYLSKKFVGKPLYVICSECNKCYNINLIKMFCNCCKTEYYTSKLDENDNENILPATWKEYHCKPIIVNETMKCIKCENVLYINLYNKKLVCLNIKCNFSSDAKSIIWKCKLCHNDFTSEAKIFNPLDNKILHNSVVECLLNKEICLPQKLYCCCLIKKNTKYFHNKKCDGELYKGLLDNKSIVVCAKCHAVNYYEKFVWICPICNIKFYYNGKKYKKDITNIKSTKTFYSLEKYKNLNNNINEINKAQRNLSSNIRLYIHKFNDKNKMTLENNDYNNKIYNKNTFDNSKKNITEKNIENNLNMNGFISKFKYLRKKKNSRYRTLYDILKEKKNQRNKSINELNYNITEDINDTSYQYRLKDKIIDEDKPQTASKKLKDRKNLIQNYIYKNDIVVNININSNNIKNNDNLINISNISNSDKIISKKNIFERIEETENENNIYEYESIRKNLHKKFKDDLNNNNKDNSKNLEYNFIPNKNSIINSIHKEKSRDISNERYKLIYNSHSIINEKEKMNENRNDKRESIFYKKNIRNKFFKEEKIKNNTLNIKTEDNDTTQNNIENKYYRKFWKKENKIEEKKTNSKNNKITIKNSNETKVYNSSRLKQNKFHKKLFLEKSEQNNNNNIILNDIPEYVDNSIPISELGDIGSSLISKDDFLKISKECKIPTYDENNISYIRPIGQGSFGVIYLVEEKNNKKNQYALKSILCNDLEQILKHKKEFELSYSLSHNNFIKIYNALFKYLDMTTYMLYILMERGESDWSTEIEKRSKLNNYYTEKELINILKQLVDVLCFFQKNNIAHRDIKPQNILIFKNNIYKITDLGEAKGANNNVQLATLKGSQFFMSPNLYFSFKYNGNNTKVIHNIYKSDVFSLGYCFLYAMNLNMKLIQKLREENNMINIINIIKKFGLNSKYSEKFMNIIYNMIEIDENKRLDFIELFNEINNIF